MEQELLDANQDTDDVSSDTSTQDTSSEDAKHIEIEEDLDNVPFHEHPRFKELINERNALRCQINDLSSEMQSIKAKVDKPVATDTDTQLRNMSEEELINLDIASTDADNPNYEELKPLRRNIVKALDEKRIEKTVRVLTLEDENKRIQQKKVEADTRALAAYPDIAKPETEMFKTAQAIMLDYGNELIRAGADINRIPRFLEICVDKAAEKLGIEAKAALKKGQTMEYDRNLAAGKAGFDGGYKKTTVKEPEITERQARISKMMGVDPKIAAGIKKRLMNDGLIRRTE